MRASGNFLTTGLTTLILFKLNWRFVSAYISLLEQSLVSFHSFISFYSFQSLISFHSLISFQSLIDLSDIGNADSLHLVQRTEPQTKVCGNQKYTHFDISRRHCMHVSNRKVKHVVGLDSSAAGGGLPWVEDYSTILFFICHYLK